MDFTKKTFSDFINENKVLIGNTTFINPITLSYDANVYAMPQEKVFFLPINNQTYLFTFKGKKLKVELSANFIVLNSKECTKIYNDKSGKKPEKFYLVDLKNSSGYTVKDVEISGSSKSDYRYFEEVLNTNANNFASNMKNNEHKAFISRFISPKVSKNIVIYKNAGVIRDGEFLCENAYIKKGEIIWADEDGYIKVSENDFIKVEKSFHELPKLYKSNRSTQEIMYDFIENLILCWGDNLLLALLVLGHMMMAVFFEKFIDIIGVPTLVLYGDSGSGKTTIVNTGLACFGLSSDAMKGGNSTSRSTEYLCANYNGCNVCIDDFKGSSLCSEYFTATMKTAYNGRPRAKMLPYGRGIETIQTCSQLVLSTNETLPDLPEVTNRLNTIKIFGKIFKSDDYNYHETNKDKLNELSVALPEILKYSFEEVFKIYDNYMKLLEEHLPKKSQTRVLNNLSYAYTGVRLLLQISNMKIENLDNKFIEYAKTQINEYEGIQNIVDRVLNLIPLMIEKGIIEKDIDFKFQDNILDDNKIEKLICFRKSELLSMMNKFYSYDKALYINEKAFSSYAECHKRFRGYKSARLNGNTCHSIWFNVTELDGYSDCCSVEKPIVDVRNLF